jgi:hypothetical protein
LGERSSLYESRSRQPVGPACGASLLRAAVSHYPAVRGKAFRHRLWTLRGRARKQLQTRRHKAQPQCFAPVIEGARRIPLSGQDRHQCRQNRIELQAVRCRGKETYLGKQRDGEGQVALQQESVDGRPRRLIQFDGHYRFSIVCLAECRGKIGMALNLQPKGCTPARLKTLPARWQVSGKSTDHRNVLTQHLSLPISRSPALTAANSPRRKISHNDHT